MALLTVGDPDRVTGGYLFHRRLADRAARNGAELRFVSVPALPLPWAIAAGPRWLNRPALREADIVVLDSIAAAAAAPWLGRIDVPIVGMLHQPVGGMASLRLGRWISAPFDRWAYRQASLLMVASDWLAIQLAEDGLPRRLLRVVVPGKDLDPDADENHEGAEEIAAIRDRLRDGRDASALCVANWLPRKGVLELLDAVAGLPDGLVTLHLVGDTRTPGPYAGRVRARLENRALSARTVVHGLISPALVQQMYRSVDFFVLPSFEEPYGTVWGEAMAAGLPVVGWRAGNLPFLASHGHEALMAPPGDVTALASAIQRLATDSDLRARMARAAEERAAVRPTWDETAARFFSVLEEVLAGDAGGSEWTIDGRPGLV